MRNKKVCGAVIVIVLFFFLWLLYVMFPGRLSGNVIANAGQPSTEQVPNVNPGRSISELGERFLTTKSTGENGLGCGPPDDFDCGVSRYSSYMALTNIQAYENTNDKKYLDYAIKFAMVKQAEDQGPPEWCPACTCNPPADFDCGTGEVQAKMIDVFARLYHITGEESYLEYAEKFAHTTSSDTALGCKDCSCGPPDDFDCGQTYVQLGYLNSYNTMYDVTGNPEYLDYAKELGNAWMKKTLGENGPRLIELFLRVYDLTGDKKYSDRAINLGSEITRDSCAKTTVEWNSKAHYDYDESAYVGSLAQLYRATRDEQYLECAKKIIKNSGQCKEGVCRSMVQQASIIHVYVDMFRTTGLPEYLELAEEFAEPDNINAVQSNIFGYTTSCKDFDCEDSEDNAFIAGALLELAEARGETFG